MATDTLLLTAPDFSGWSSDPARPDYASPAYREQTKRWQLVHDARGNTEAMRAKAATYLPKFEAESQLDWEARVRQTFANDHYGMTIDEHVGLVMAQPIKLGDDVPQEIKDLIEDVDGEGNHLDVFANTSFDGALHLGHAVIFTDYPVTADGKPLTWTPPPGYSTTKTKADATAAKARPYATLYTADDALSFREEVVGGVRMIVQIVFRERTSEAVGEFGVEQCTRYREVQQEVFYDEFSGRAVRLGAITWVVWERDKTPEGQPAVTFSISGQGTMTGPERIPARVIYGGQKLGTLKTKPHVFGLALSNIEETQVQSDYAAVMHKCNVPTPVFIGRVPVETGGAAQTIQMGQGIDIPAGSDAKFLEPTGVALAATRARLQDIQAQMRRQGATSDDSGKVMTAAEAAIYAKQRNAKLAKAARSLQDALEGMLSDFAAFMGLAKSGAVKSGGSVVVNTNFTGRQLDPALLQVYVSAFAANALPLDALLYALEKGQLPDDFSAQDSALRLIAEDAAASARLRLEAEARAKAAASGGAPPPAPGANPPVPEPIAA